MFDKLNNWYRVKDVPTNQIDAVIAGAEKVKKKDVKFRLLSKQTVKDTRFYLYAACYGRRVKCYGSKLGKLKDNEYGLPTGLSTTKLL